MAFTLGADHSSCFFRSGKVALMNNILIFKTKRHPGFSIAKMFKIKFTKTHFLLLIKSIRPRGLFWHSKIFDNMWHVIILDNNVILFSDLWFFPRISLDISLGLQIYFVTHFSLFLESVNHSSSSWQLL